MNKNNIKLSIFWVFSFIVIIFMMTFSSHAESPYFPMIQNNGNITSETGKNTIDTTLNSEDYYIFTVYRDTYNSRQRYYYVKFPKNQDGKIYGEISNNGYQFSLYTVGGSGRFYIAGGLQLKSDGTLYNYTENFDNLSYFQNLVSSNYQVANSFMSNFWLYNNNTESKIALLQYGPDPDVPEPEIGLGHATPPDSFEDPTLATGSNHTLPREVPETPNINNYTWITYNPPAIDTTNVESLLESLIYVINYLAGWLRDNLAGEFQNLISNITGLIIYIVETIQYYGGLIISNIQNGIETFYNNMVSLFEPVAAKINYLTEPLDSTIIFDNISTTSLVTNIGTIQTSLSSFQAAFTGVDEPTSYTIPIHLENLPSNWFGNQTTQYIDLGVINGTVKDGLRLFVWAMVTYSLVVTIFDSISNYINGGGDES